MNKIGDRLYIRDELEESIMNTFHIFGWGNWVNGNTIQRHTEKKRNKFGKWKLRFFSCWVNVCGIAKYACTSVYKPGTLVYKFCNLYKSGAHEESRGIYKSIRIRVEAKLVYANYTRNRSHQKFQCRECEKELRLN